MTLTKWPRILLAFILMFNVFSICAQQQATNQDMLVRIAAIEIFPEYWQEYTTILKEEAAASIKIEAGVICIFPMVEQQQPHQIRIIEIYANQDAYKSHLETPHFQHYKTSTAKMVKSLKLVNMEALDKQAMLQLFKKLP